MTKLPTTTITHDGDEFTISYEPVLECEHCGYDWPSTAQSRRPTCPDCGRKTDRNEVGKYHHDYIKFTLSTDPLPETTDEVAGLLHAHARRYEAMKANGWEVTDVTGDGHVDAEYYE